MSVKNLSFRYAKSYAGLDLKMHYFFMCFGLSCTFHLTFLLVLFLGALVLLSVFFKWHAFCDKIDDSLYSGCLFLC
jgi:hypothetical protein